MKATYVGVMATPTTNRRGHGTVASCTRCGTPVSTRATTQYPGCADCRYVDPNYFTPDHEPRTA